MPRVRPHTRRNGSRVRGHYRRRRGSGGVGRRTVRRGGRSGGGAQDVVLPMLAVGGGLMAVAFVVEFVQRHPYWSAFVVFLVVAVGVTVISAVLRSRAQQRAEQAARDRLIASTDTMSGRDFEEWFGRLLTATGCTNVRVCGSSGDRGADVIATTPDGRRLVAQCKRHKPDNRIGSRIVQQFAGTCRAVHGGDICMIVTNGYFTNGDGLRLARELDILLVDRSALAAWALTGMPPVPLAGQWPSSQPAA